MSKSKYDWTQIERVFVLRTLVSFYDQRKLMRYKLKFRDLIVAVCTYTPEVLNNNLNHLVPFVPPDNPEQDIKDENTGLIHVSKTLPKIDLENLDQYILDIKKRFGIN